MPVAGPGPAPSVVVGTIAGTVAAVRGGRDIALSAYTLRCGPLLAALEAAGDRGARVVVRLEAHPMQDAPGDGLAQQNAAVVAELREHHVDAALADRPPATLHLKAAVVDGTAYLDDRNWAGDGREIILTDRDPDDVRLTRAAVDGRSAATRTFATRKDDATKLEARAIYAGEGHDVAVESESFGYGHVYAALLTRARAGDRVRLLVNERDLAHDRREQAALGRLAAAGVEVRAGDDDEKIALAGGQGWVGSANATIGRPDTVDWGLRTSDPSLRETLREHFETNWSRARCV